MNSQTAHELAMALRSAYWELHRTTDSVLEPLGVTANQFVLLSLINEHGSVIQQQLVELASSDPNTVRSMLNVLERNGLVKRQVHHADRRAWLVSLTSKGKRAFQKMWEATDAVRKEVMVVVEQQDRNQLLQLLTSIAAQSLSLRPPTRTPVRRSQSKKVQS